MAAAWLHGLTGAAVLVYAGGALAQPAAPQATPQAPAVSSDPQVTTATFADWTLRCQRFNEGHKICEVAQAIQAQNGPLAQIAIGRIGPKDPVKLTVILVPNVSFPSSVRMRVDEKDNQPADLGWRRCTAANCAADVEIRDETLRRWRAQNERGQLLFRDSTGREITLPFSFRGLAQALDALAKA